MAYLYKNPNGYEVRSHSHSGGQDWSCPRRYYWKRIKGWQSKEDSVGTRFGKAIESAIQYYHNKDFEPGSGVEEFKLLWFKEKENTEITYTEKSGNWDDHYRMGVELLKLYEIVLPELPITRAKFQVEYKADLFKGVPQYEGLKYRSIIDMLCTADPRHPALPRTETKAEEIDFIVDIKTSSYAYYSDPRMSGLDEQLRDYAWITGLNMVAFLVLVKNHSSIGTGDWITVLEGEKIGKKYQVFDVTEDRVLVLPKELYEEYSSRKKEIKGKGAKERQEALLTEYFYKGLSFKPTEITKQKIQFLPAIISQEDADEARREAIHETKEIADYTRENYYPKHPGVRFPNNVCTNCECLGLCIGDEDMVKEKLVQINEVF